VDNKPPGIRRLCVAFAAQSSGGPGGGDLASAERRAANAFTDVCTSFGLDRMLLNHRADGEVRVGLLPVGIDEPRVVASLVDGLSRAIAELNVPRSGRPSTRLRLAFHEGVTTLAADGFGGTAVARVRQLAESPQLRAALDEHPRASLAVLLSDPLFQDICPFGYPGLCADQFRQVEIAGLDHARGHTAWICIPGQPNGDGRPAARVLPD
jgi:hypothetical protein